MKAPSDNEDGGTGGGELRPGKPGDYVTLKFPSDGEDGGARPPADRPTDAVTLKYPSDGEDAGGGTRQA